MVYYAFHGNPRGRGHGKQFAVSDKVTLPFDDGQTATHASNAPAPPDEPVLWEATSGPHTVGVRLERLDGTEGTRTAYETVYVGTKTAKPDLVVTGVDAVPEGGDLGKIRLRAVIANHGNIL